MACRGLWECLLKVLNFLLLLVGLAMIGYGVYLVVEYTKGAPANGDGPISPSSGEFVQLGRPMLLVMSLPDSILDKLPKAWFIYLFIGIGAIVILIAACGCIGTATRSGYCLTCYSLLLILLILVELGMATFIFFDKSWKKEIPIDKTGDFDMIYSFLEKHWKIIKWVALGAVILEALIFLLALIVRAANSAADYDSEEEYIGGPRQHIRQPLTNRAAVPATGVPVAGTLDPRPSRSDAWSARMREKMEHSQGSYTSKPRMSCFASPSTFKFTEVDSDDLLLELVQLRDENLQLQEEVGYLKASLQIAQNRLYDTQTRFQNVIDIIHTRITELLGFSATLLNLSPIKDAVIPDMSLGTEFDPIPLD